MNLKILHNVSQASKRFDLATAHDLLEFSIHFAKFGHDLLNHRKFQRPLSGERQTARSWSELTQTLGPDDWAELEQSNVNRKRENYDMPTM